MSEATFLSIKPADEKIYSGAQLFELPVDPAGSAYFGRRKILCRSLSCV